MFNKVVLVGNLTRDIEMRYAPSGAAIGKTAIAVTRRFTGSNGEKKEEACFIDIDFFGRLAEIANQYLNKGSKVLIEGRLKFEQWSDQNGQNRSKHTIAVENMEMLGSNPNSSGNFARPNQNYDPYESRPNQQPPQQRTAQPQGYAQPQQSYAKQHPQEEKLKEINLDDYDDDKSELPF